MIVSYIQLELITTLSVVKLKKVSLDKRVTTRSESFSSKFYFLHLLLLILHTKVKVKLGLWMEAIA